MLVPTEFSDPNAQAVVYLAFARSFSGEREIEFSRWTFDGSFEGCVALISLEKPRMPTSW